MPTQRIATVFGLVFLLVGVLGFVQTGTSQEMSMLLNFFPVNFAHNVVHCLFGVWGLAASRSAGGATSYCKIGGAVYLLLGVLGFVVENPLGIVPIGGNDRWLHLALGAVLFYAGMAMGGAKSSTAG
jgi:preprotein translocase subunit Sss1